MGQHAQTDERVSSGADWLDEILHGGFLKHRSYLVRGGPGTGKTTLGLHFLTAGARLGEKSLYISLGEPEQQIRDNAAHQGFDLTDVSVLDLSPSPDFFAQMKSYEIFSPAEVEREPITKKIIDHVTGVGPHRVFVDPISQLRYLSQDAFQFRRQALSFLHFLQEQGATVLFTSETSDNDPDDYIQVIGDGVLNLENKLGTRTMTVTKFRGSAFASGQHAIKLTGHGLEVYPRLVPEDYGLPFNPESIPFGVPELDAMTRGGLERGTVSILTGPSGVGKTSLGIQFMREAATRGERSVIYSFEEEVEVMLHRAEGLGIPARRLIREGSLSVVKVEPLVYSADEFARMVRTEVEEKGTRIVMIDSMAGFRLSLKGEDMVGRLHAQCKYLQNMGVAVLLINEVESVGGDFRVTDLKISYLADNVIYIRYMERHNGDRVSLCKALGVLKKRLTDFDSSIRELTFDAEGIHVSQPLVGVNSILSGFPVWTVAREDA
ncbi:MAG: putative circadian clock protein KaiC [Cyanobacteria bacterium RYN_339]|nr:putative circadian clock protein KaiC [Cyanobacteria bacterium RYN_339]